ncbi:MAG: carboxypeptidase-like regulatory domain-containing protein [Bryobacteraceae bacterium]
MSRPLLFCLVSLALALRLAAEDLRGAGTISFESFHSRTPEYTGDRSEGVALNFRTLVPRLGLLTTNIEVFSNRAGWRPGLNYASLDDVRIGAHRWKFTVGNAQVDPFPVQQPFPNVPYPRLNINGLRVEVSGEKSYYSAFAGQQYFLQGTRISLRYPTGQSVAGILYRRRVAQGIEVGIRALHFGRPSANTAAIEFAWRPRDSLRVFAEAGAPASVLIGATWETRRALFRSTYVRQNAAYLPVVGYLNGARRGPFAEARLNLFRDAQVFGSASNTETVFSMVKPLQRYAATSLTAGASGSLPGSIALSAQFTHVELRTLSGSQTNQIAAFRAARQFRVYTLRAELRQIATLDTRQRSVELEHYVRLRRLSLLGATRLQRESTGVRGTTLVYRGGLQLTLARLSLYASGEAGRDLAARSLLTTTLTQNTAAGAEWRIVNGWGLAVDAWSARLLNTNRDLLALSTVNPIFAAGAFERNQWSAYLRLTHDFAWGGATSVGDLGQYSRASTPLVGVIAGQVHVAYGDGSSIAADIPVSLDGDRIAMTNAAGGYEFSNVPEGRHTLMIDERQLPVDYLVPTVPATSVVVAPGRRVREDFVVQPSVGFGGQVDTDAGMPLEGIVVRLHPGNRRTVTDREGRFRFDGLREGDYEIDVDGEARVAVRVAHLAEPGVVLRVKARTTEKPTRLIELPAN